QPLHSGSALLEAASAFRICAFNVQAFGDSKASDRGVMEVLVKILSRCDVCLIQEVRDSKGGAVPALVNNLNRSDVVDVRDQYQYPDTQKGDPDAFSREPFIVRFHSPHTGQCCSQSIPHTQVSAAVRAFPPHRSVLQSERSPHTGQCCSQSIPHTQVSAAVRAFPTHRSVLQSEHSPTQVSAAVRAFPTHRSVLQSERSPHTGQCCSQSVPHTQVSAAVRAFPTHRSVLQSERSPHTGQCCSRSIPHTQVHWLLCVTVLIFPFLRIVVHGDAFLSAIVPQSAKPFNFPREFRLTEEEALVISDHYPVEVELRLSSGQQEVHIHHYLIGIAVAVLLLSVMCGPNGCSGF
ncbi:UNVERIFIED_CONTAM: hypothetical protein FKN15_035531, partial [Acipenser sinensis]